MSSPGTYLAAFLCGGLLFCQLHITRTLGGKLLQV